MLQMHDWESGFKALPFLKTLLQMTKSHTEILVKYGTDKDENICHIALKVIIHAKRRKEERKRRKYKFWVGGVDGGKRYR